MVIISQHTSDRLIERGATESEVITTIEKGEKFPAKYGRYGFRLNFLFNAEWNGKYYTTKQVEVFTVLENNDWIAVTVIVKYF